MIHPQHFGQLLNLRPNLSHDRPSTLPAQFGVTLQALSVPSGHLQSLFNAASDTFFPLSTLSFSSSTDFRDFSGCGFAILPAPAHCLISTPSSLARSSPSLPSSPTSHSCSLRDSCGDCAHSPSLSAKTSCSRFRCILGEFLVDLVLGV